MSSFKSLLLLCFLLIAGSLYCQLKEFDIRQTDSPAALAVIQRDFPQSVCLSVYSSIPNLSFESNMDGIEGDRSKPEEGKYLVYLKPTRQIITVKAMGYRESYIQIPAGLKAKESIYYLIEPKATSLKTEKGSFVLESNPAGADIRIDGIPTFAAKTPYTFENFAAMTYKISLSFPRYATLETTITIDKSKPLSKTVELQPTWAELKISSTPAGSTIYLNKKPVGTTPLELTGSAAGLDAGVYALELIPASEYYAPYNQSLTLKAGDKVNLTPVHRDISGYLQLDISLTPVSITLNNAAQPSLASGANVRLTAGDYSLKAEYQGAHKSAFPPVTTELSLSAGQNQKLPITFIPRQGTIQTQSKPQGIEYQLTDKETGKIFEWNEDKDSPVVYAGDYSLTAVKSGYRKYHKELTFNGGNYPLEVSLINIDALYQRKLTYWSANTYYTGGAALVTLAATAVFYSQVQSNYDQYQKAVTSSAAADYKQKTETATTFYNVGLGLDVVAVSCIAYSFLKKYQWQSKMRKEMEK